MRPGAGASPLSLSLPLSSLCSGLTPRPCPQKLQAFYPPGSLEPIAQRIVQTGALSQIASLWRLPMEIAIDLCRLALFEIVLYVDDSGSMCASFPDLFVVRIDPENGLADTVLARFARSLRGERRAH